MKPRFRFLKPKSRILKPKFTILKPKFTILKAKNLILKPKIRILKPTFRIHLWGLNSSIQPSEILSTLLKQRSVPTIGAIARETKSGFALELQLVNKNSSQIYAKSAQNRAKRLHLGHHFAVLAPTWTSLGRPCPNLPHQIFGEILAQNQERCLQNTSSRSKILQTMI